MTTTIINATAPWLEKEEATTATLLTITMAVGSDPVHFLTAKQSQDAVSVLRVCQYVLAAIAVPATLCNVIVFTRKSMRRSATSAYVIGISVAQLYCVLSSNVSHALSHAITDPLSGTPWCASYYFSFYVFIYGYTVSQRAFYVLTCLLSLQRLYAVARPLHLRTFFLATRPALCTGLVLLLSALWHVYLLTKFTIHREVRRRSNSNGAASSDVSVCVFARTAAYTQAPALNDAIGLSAKVVLSYAALTLQLVLNVLMTLALRRHNVASSQIRGTALQRNQTSSSGTVEGAEEEESQRQRRGERQMTRTVLVTTACYVALSLPAEVNNFLSTAVEGYTDFGEYRRLYKVLVAVSFNLNTLGSAIDLLCFYKLSSRYRHVLHGLLRCGGSGGGGGGGGGGGAATTTRNDKQQGVIGRERDDETKDTSYTSD